jgi:hypothetical protein
MVHENRQSEEHATASPPLELGQCHRNRKNNKADENRQQKEKTMTMRYARIT